MVHGTLYLPYSFYKVICQHHGTHPMLSQNALLKYPSSRNMLAANRTQAFQIFCIVLCLISILCSLFDLFLLLSFFISLFFSLQIAACFYFVKLHNRTIQYASITVDVARNPSQLTRLHTDQQLLQLVTVRQGSKRVYYSCWMGLPEVTCQKLFTRDGQNMPIFIAFLNRSPQME